MHGPMNLKFGDFYLHFIKNLEPGDGYDKM